MIALEWVYGYGNGYFTPWMIKKKDFQWLIEQKWKSKHQTGKKNHT